LIEDRGQTDHIDPWPWPVTFSFEPLEATVVTHTHAKHPGQRSVGLKIEWKQTEKQMDEGNCITFNANEVGKNNVCSSYS